MYIIFFVPVPAVCLESTSKSFRRLPEVGLTGGHYISTPLTPHGDIYSFVIRIVTLGFSTPSSCTSC